MKLTRRDALVALGGAGTAAGAVGLGTGLFGTDEAPTDDPPLGAHERDTATALAVVLYPGAVSGVEQFVETYLQGLGADRPDHAAAVGDAVGVLDEYCRTWWGRPYVELPADRREAAPAEMGLSITDPAPAGTDTERVRYYLVDELLYALYATPTGGDLLGIENPPGHPGGLESYQRGHDRE